MTVEEVEWLVGPPDEKPATFSTAAVEPGADASLNWLRWDYCLVLAVKDGVVIRRRVQKINIWP